MVDISRNHDYPENAVERQLSARFGHAARVLASSACRTRNLHELAIHLWPAVRLNQIGFLFNSKGSPVAFATWAFVTDEVAQTMISDPRYCLDIGEWNEGDQLWLMDFVAFPGEAWNLVRRLREFYLPGPWRVRGIRRYANSGKAPRIVDFRRKAS